MSHPSMLFPPLLWAQRPEYILLTVALQDATNVMIELNPEGTVLTFSCFTPDGTHYACTLELYGAIAAEESSNVIRPRQIEMKLKKKKIRMISENTSEEHTDKPDHNNNNNNNNNNVDNDAEEEDDDSRVWPRLTKHKMKNTQIQIDWNKWRDDDNDGNKFGDMDDLGDFGLNYDDVNMRGDDNDYNDSDDDAANNDANQEQNSDMLNKFMQAQAKREAAERAGVSEDKLPDFASAKGQQPMTEDEIAKGEANEAVEMKRQATEDEDDVPAFEEEEVAEGVEM